MWLALTTPKVPEFVYNITGGTWLTEAQVAVSPGIGFGEHDGAKGQRLDLRAMPLEGRQG